MLAPILWAARNWRLLAAGAAVAAIAGGGFWAGWRLAQASNYIEIMAAKNREVIQLAATNAALADQRMAERAQRAAEDALVLAARDLEDTANAHPVTDGCGLPVERVRRLNLR